MIERKDYEDYIYLHSDMVLTKFNPLTDDIRDYYGSKNIYCHTEEEVASYYEITEEQHFEYERQKREVEEQDIRAIE